MRRLAERLKAAGVRVWLDEWVIKAGDIIALKVDEGLEQSRVLLLCISPAALASGWVALERSTAVHRDPANAGRRFIPLLLGDCDLPDTLRRYKYVDFRKESEAAFADLLAACQAEGQVLVSNDALESRPTLVRGLFRRAFAKQPSITMPESATKRLKETAWQPATPPKKGERLAVLERALAAHKNWVRSVAISRDSKWVASGSADMTVKLWNLETGRCSTSLQGHTDFIRAVAFTPDDKRIISGSKDQSVRVWDVGTGRELARLKGHSGNK